MDKKNIITALVIFLLLTVAVIVGKYIAIKFAS